MKTMVRKILDEKSKARNLDARNNRVTKSKGKGKSVSAERNRGECHHWKAKGKCSRVDACSFRHDTCKRGASPRSSSPAPKSQTNNDGKSSTKRKIRPEDTVPRRRGARDRADISFLVTARIHRVTCGILQCVKVTSRIQASNMATSVRSFTKRRTISRKGRKREEEKDK